MTEKRRETDLYAPVAEFLAEKGFKVRSEVRGLDVAAVKGETLVVVELKLSFNLKLLMQAADRLSITDYVYVAIPRPEASAKNGINSGFWNDMLNILKRLEIGLLLVSLDSPLKTVEPVLHPMARVLAKKTHSRINVLKEIDSRVGDFNTGGSGRSKILTALREKSIQIACMIYREGELSTRELRLRGITQRELLLLSKNYYNWFRRVQTGVYALTEEGASYIESPEERFEAVVKYYRDNI